MQKCVTLSSKLDIQWSFEKGISFARNTAVSLATGDFLAWIDDDETAAENWLIALDDTIDERCGCRISAR